MQTLDSCFDLVGSPQQSVCGNDDPDGLKFKCPPIGHSHTERVSDSIGQELEISYRCLDKESEDRQNYSFTENMDKTM